jgi:hypothetical protein
MSDCAFCDDYRSYVSAKNLCIAAVKVGNCREGRGIRLHWPSQYADNLTVLMYPTPLTAQRRTIRRYYRPTLNWAMSQRIWTACRPAYGTEHHAALQDTHTHTHTHTRKRRRRKYNVLCNEKGKNKRKITVTDKTAEEQIHKRLPRLCSVSFFIAFCVSAHSVIPHLRKLCRFFHGRIPHWGQYETSF